MLSRSPEATGPSDSAFRRVSAADENGVSSPTPATGRAATPVAIPGAAPRSRTAKPSMGDIPRSRGPMFPSSLAVFSPAVAGIGAISSAARLSRLPYPPSRSMPSLSALVYASSYMIWSRTPTPPEPASTTIARGARVPSRTRQPRCPVSERVAPKSRAFVEALGPSSGELRTNRTRSLHLERLERVPRSTEAAIASMRSIGRVSRERGGTVARGPRVACPTLGTDRFALETILTRASSRLLQIVLVTTLGLFRDG